MSDLPGRRPFPKVMGWVIPVFMIGWLAFLFLPMPRPEPPPPRILAQVPTKLELAGLPNGLDFEGVPDFFAAFVDHAEWKDNRTLFAYWHPVMETYSYYFEATRVGDHFHFREIPEPSKVAYALADDLPDDCPIRFYHSVPVPVPAEVRGPLVAPSMAHDPVPVMVKVNQPRPDPLPPPAAPAPKP